MLKCFLFGLFSVFLTWILSPPPPASPSSIFTSIHYAATVRICVCVWVGLSGMSVTGSNYGYGYIAIRGVLAKVCSCSLTPKLRQLSSLLSLHLLLTPRLSSAVSTVRCNLSVEQHLAPRTPSPFLVHRMPTQLLAYSEAHCKANPASCRRRRPFYLHTGSVFDTL